MIARHTILTRLVPTTSLVLLTSCVLFAGCGPDSGADKFENEAEAVYLRNLDYDINNPDCSVEPGEVQVEVVFTSCGSACSTLKGAECSASLDGDQIEVTSQGKIKQSGNPLQACPAVCSQFLVRCDLGELDEGTYTINHGDWTKTVTLPGEQEPCF